MTRSAERARDLRSAYSPAIPAALMSVVIAGAGLGLVAATSRAGSAAPTAVAPMSQAEVHVHYGSLPLSFEPNVGQGPAGVRFLAHGGGYTTQLESDRVVMVPGDGGTPVEMRLVGSAPHPTMSGGESLPGVVNYLVGNVPSRWHTNVPTYSAVTYRAVYPGIDMTWHGSQGAPEYDFTVAPGADPSAIALTFPGATAVAIDAAGGDLIVTMPSGTMRQHRPQLYQETAAGRRPVTGRFLESGSRVGFAVGEHDARRALTIDPTFTYSTYLGGSGNDSGYAIAVDPGGNAYVAGATCSADFPTRNPVQSTYTSSRCNDNVDQQTTYGSAVITKLNPQGSALVYSTYLGGTLPTAARGVAVDGSGNAYVTGITQAADFPTTANALQTTCSPDVTHTQGFATELTSQGSALAYSTCLGGSGRFDLAEAIQVHGGHVYIGGYTTSADFPVTPGALQTIRGGSSTDSFAIDAFMSEINPAGGGSSDLVYSTFLGGSGDEQPGGRAGLGLAVDTTGIVYVAGATQSTDFPVTSGAYQLSLAGPADPLRQDAFLSKINPAGGGLSDLLYSTYLGGQAGPYSQFGNALGTEGATGVGLGPPVAGSTSPTVYVGGFTTSADFPTTPGAVEVPPLVCSDFGCLGFLSRINPAGAGTSDLVYATYIGAPGAANDLNSLAVNPTNGDAVVGGWTLGSNLLTQDPVQGTCGCFTTKNPYAGDAWVSEVNADPTGSATTNLVFSTFIGGTGYDATHALAVDISGSIYVAGETGGPGKTGTRAFPPLPFPTSPGAYQRHFAGGVTGGDFPVDAFVTKIAFADLSVRVSASPSPATIGRPLTYVVTVKNHGPSAVTPVVTDVLPVGLTYVTASGGCSPVTVGRVTTVTCSLANPALGRSVVATITVRPQAQATFTNTVTVDGNAADPVPSNNTAGVRVQVM